MIISVRLFPILLILSFDNFEYYIIVFYILAYRVYRSKILFTLPHKNKATYCKGAIWTGLLGDGCRTREKKKIKKNVPPVGIEPTTLRLLIEVNLRRHMLDMRLMS